MAAHWRLPRPIIRCWSLPFASRPRSHFSRVDSSTSLEATALETYRGRYPVRYLHKRALRRVRLRIAIDKICGASLVIEVGAVVRAHTRAGTKMFVRVLGLTLLTSSMAMADTPDPASTAKPALKDNAKGAAQDDTLESVYVEGKRWLFNRRTRYAHSLPEVDGPTITVTKKTSVVQLNDVPTIIDNNQRELFDRLPGIVIAEQQNPTELNLSYRGLGNPQESEYV